MCVWGGGGGGEDCTACNNLHVENTACDGCALFGSVIVLAVVVQQPLYRLMMAYTCKTMKLLRLL